MPEQLSSSALRVDFTGLSWQQVRPGVRHKVYREGSRQLRLVEFDTSDGVCDWCQVGHIGYVLAGGLNIDVNGSILQFAAGDGLFIPPGSVTQHRPVTIEPGTRLLMVEDVDMEE